MNKLQPPVWLLSLATPLFFLHKTHLGSNKKWQKHNCGEIDVQNIEDYKNVHGTHLQATQTQFELGKPQPSNQFILNYQELFAKYRKHHPFPIYNSCLINVGMEYWSSPLSLHEMVIMHKISFKIFFRDETSDKPKENRVVKFHDEAPERGRSAKKSMKVGRRVIGMLRMIVMMVTYFSVLW